MNMANKASTVGSAPTFANVYDILIQDLHFYWYEIFVCLGISRERLKEIEAKYPFEAHMCLFEAVKLWINREDPPPKWQDLVNVLRYKILENKAAQRIEKLYLIDPEEELRELERQRKKKKNEPQYLIPPPPKLERNSLEFSRFILKYTERIGSDSYTELYHCMEQFRSPDGSQIFDEEELSDHRSIDSMLIPIVYSNMCNCRDVDVVVYVLKALGRDDILPVIQEYIPRVDMGAEVPHPVHEPAQFFAVHFALGTSEPVDIPRIAAIKHSLCACFGFEESPHLIQFLGWEGEPMILSFQAPMACTLLVIEGIMKHPDEIKRHGIVHANVDINGVKFPYDLKNKTQA